MSYRPFSNWASLDSVVSIGGCIGSAGVPGCEYGGGFTEGYESRCTKACRDARLLISRRPTRSPRLKLPFPCLNSHNGDSGEPVWKTSLTNYHQRRNNSMSKAVPTLVETVHVQLPNKR